MSASATATGSAPGPDASRIRAGLAAHFPGDRIAQSFDPRRQATILRIYRQGSVLHELAIPTALLDDQAITVEVSERLLSILRLAGPLPVTMTAHGLRIEAVPDPDSEAGGGDRGVRP